MNFKIAKYPLCEKSSYDCNICHTSFAEKGLYFSYQKIHTKECCQMRRLYSKSFEELVEENKKELMNNPVEIRKIELKVEKKQLIYSKNH